MNVYPTVVDTSSFYRSFMEEFSKLAASKDFARALFQVSSKVRSGKTPISIANLIKKAATGPKKQPWEPPSPEDGVEAPKTDERRLFTHLGAGTGQLNRQEQAMTANTEWWT